MTRTDSNHCQIVAECLAGRRDVDAHALVSLSVLDERLERLRRLGGAFSGVVFSRAVERLRKHNSAVTVG